MDKPPGKAPAKELLALLILAFRTVVVGVIGGYDKAERRMHVWHQPVDAPGEARSDLWQLAESLR